MEINVYVVFKDGSRSEEFQCKGYEYIEGGQVVRFTMELRQMSDINATPIGVIWKDIMTHSISKLECVRN